MDDNNQVNEPGATYERLPDFDQIRRLFLETDKKYQEIAERFKETDKILTEKFKKTDKEINKLSALFTSQWGKLIESLVEGDLIKLLKKRDILFERTIQRVKGNYQGQNYEYDIIAVNGEEIVIVEVKTTLRPDDVKDFHEKLWKAKKYIREYKDKTVFGCMAYLTAEGNSDRMAQKSGFFALKATGSSASIINSDDFKPKAF
jgi:hypothetical protein